jgi:arsenate reductase
MTITIYHNPRCSKSRQTLALLEERGFRPKIVLYLDNPPTEKELQKILKGLGKKPRDVMRKKEAPFKALNLGEESLDEAALIRAMVENPILIERPIVVKGNKAAIGRPPEAVLEIL